MRAAGIGIIAIALVWALPTSAQDDLGEATFERHCVHCHGPGAEAVGTAQLGRTRGESFALLTERDDLVAPYIEIVVRNGLRSMPSFLPSDLTGTQLDALAEYLTRDSADR